ncbi:MAG: glycoside hydrolase family 15 protein, partial [Actinomycetota bacterium]|nr:glycoside hydrolase family 15 protein [Actinomycetota bacterium]
MPENTPYPSISDYALIGDCRAAALVSSAGSVDWCCMPRLDYGSCFGRLLDWERGGYCSITPAEGETTLFRRYLEDTLVLETTFRSSGGEVRLFDLFAIDTEREPRCRLLRIIEGVRGHMDLCLSISPRLDYGEIEPWIRHHGMHVYSAIGGNDGLVITSDFGLTMAGRHDLEATFDVRAGERARVSITFVAPHEIDRAAWQPVGPVELDRNLEETVQWWREWSSQAHLSGPDGPGAVRSAIILKALTNADTGATAAAATTSLPESAGGNRNWDYRYSWIRDSAFSVRSLAGIGCISEADEFRGFIERSSAGSAKKMQIMYGLGGERRLTEIILDHLEGYRGAKPVRVGNAAKNQRQLDAYGLLVEQTWRWHQRGRSPDDDYWRFLLDIIDTAAECWRKPDCGIWEMRGEPQHFVHSKVMCWAALDKGLRLSEECMRRAPVKKCEKTRDEIRAAVESEGYDKERGVIVQAFGAKELDAALLLLPSAGFISYDDERMIRTTDVICEELDDNGLLLRYRTDKGKEDGLKGKEGAFLACSFWLAECLAHQGRVEEAREVFDRASSTGNDLGLFSEEYDTQNNEML